MSKNTQFFDILRGRIENFSLISTDKRIAHEGWLTPQKIIYLILNV